MTKALFGLSLVAALAVGGTSFPASAQTPEPVTTISAAKKHHAARRAKRSRPAAGQIACTQTGCHRIPPNCFPTAGFNGWGDPTGYDVVICR